MKAIQTTVVLLHFGSTCTNVFVVYSPKDWDRVFRALNFKPDNIKRVDVKDTLQISEE